MGDPRHARKKYGTPLKPWDRKTLETESKLVEFYGLKNKRELRRLDTLLRKKRANAKSVLALPLEQREAKEKELLNSLVQLGIMRGTPTLNDVLSLNLESFLERRLQTFVWRKNLASTIKQARQFITHGHIGVEGQKVSVPSYWVSKTQEGTIAYYGTPMVIQTPERAQKDKKQLEKEFAEMRGEPEGTESVLAGEQGEKPINPDAAAAAQTNEGQ